MTVSKYSKHLTRIFVVAALVSLFFITQVGVSTAHAHALQRAIPASDTSTCVPHPLGSFAEFCGAPSITTFCSGQQFFSATDGHGVALDWTFTDQNNTCVQVTFALHNAPRSDLTCSVELYIPNADSSAIFNYTWVDSTGSHTQSFNENPVDGWQTFVDSSSTARSLTFTDHDSPGAIKLGWGSTTGHGMREICG